MGKFVICDGTVKLVSITTQSGYLVGLTFRKLQQPILLIIKVADTLNFNGRLLMLALEEV